MLAHHLITIAAIAVTGSLLIVVNGGLYLIEARRGWLLAQRYFGGV